MLHPLLPPVAESQPELLIAPNDHVAELLRLVDIGGAQLVDDSFPYNLRADVDRQAHLPFSLVLVANKVMEWVLFRDPMNAASHDSAMIDREQRNFFSVRKSNFPKRQIRPEHRRILSKPNKRKQITCWRRHA